MNKQFAFTMWVYAPVREFTPDEVDMWADCGMTVPMTPKIEKGDDVGLLAPYLDRAEKRGVKLIANVEGIAFDDYQRMGEEEYERVFSGMVDKIGSHPALYGFLVGDEPGTPEEYEASLGCIKVMKRVAPHLDPVLNYSGTMATTPKENLGGRTPAEWMKRVKDETGVNDVVFDEYSQMINDHGKTMFFETMKTMIEGAEAAGCDPWVNLLSSEHLVFHAPDEIHVRWQIHMAAVCGCRGTVWFRFYDRTIAIDAINSPIDEFGNKTEQYYAIFRTQRRFLNNYAQLPSMKRESTFTVGKDRGVYPVFGDGDHDVIRSVDAYDETVFSFFRDEEGREFLCLVNGDCDHYSVVKINYDDEKASLYNVTLNGAKEAPFKAGADVTLYPAQLVLFRIDRK